VEVVDEVGVEVEAILREGVVEVVTEETTHMEIRMETVMEIPILPGLIIIIILYLRIIEEEIPLEEEEEATPCQGEEILVVPEMIVKTRG